MAVQGQAAQRGGSRHQPRDIRPAHRVLADWVDTSERIFSERAEYDAYVTDFVVEETSRHNFVAGPNWVAQRVERWARCPARCPRSADDIQRSGRHPVAHLIEFSDEVAVNLDRERAAFERLDHRAFHARKAVDLPVPAHGGGVARERSP